MANLWLYLFLVNSFCVLRSPLWAYLLIMVLNCGYNCNCIWLWNGNISIAQYYIKIEPFFLCYDVFIFQKYIAGCFVVDFELNFPTKLLLANVRKVLKYQWCYSYTLFFTLKYPIPLFDYAEKRKRNKVDLYLILLSFFQSKGGVE